MTQTKNDFIRAVSAHPASHWGDMLQPIKPKQMRSWAASFIWWAHRKPVSPTSRLYKYMEQYDYHLDVMDLDSFELNLNNIGLFLPYTPKGYENMKRPLIQNKRERKIIK